MDQNKNIKEEILDDDKIDKNEFDNENNEETEETPDYKKMYEELNKKYIYLYSDFENFKKRMSKESNDNFEKGMITAIEPLLSVIDNFSRALKSINKDENPDIYKGIELIKKELDDYLLKFNITEIEALNEPFDPAFHNAAMFEDNNKYDEPTVLEELIKGYKMGDKVIRYSVVKVSK